MIHYSEKTGRQQTSCVRSNAMHFLAGLIRCRICDGIIVRFSGGRCYGCYNAKWNACNNKLLVPRKQVETIITYDLKEKFLTIGKTLNEKMQMELQNLLTVYYVAHTNIQILALLNEEVDRSI